jgi:hypothetical protein
MKITVEFPDPLFRRAKAAAAADGKSLKDFFTEAVHEKLQKRGSGSQMKKPWEAAFGGMKHLYEENLRIQKIISDEFETIDEEQWR